MELHAYTERQTWSSKIRKKVTISTIGLVLTVTNREDKKCKLHFYTPDLVAGKDIENLETLHEVDRDSIIHSVRLQSIQANDYITYLSTLSDTNQYSVLRVGRKPPILALKVLKEGSAEVCWEFWKSSSNDVYALQCCLTLNRDELHKLCGYATAHYMGYT